MSENKARGRIYCIISAVIIFGSYILQRVCDISVGASRTSVLVQAFCFTLATFVVYFLISKSDEIYYGILIALFGIRMMPPDITGLSDFSMSADFIYFIVQKFAVVLFVLSIIKLYREQGEDKQIMPVPVLAMIFVVPFFNQIMDAMSTYVMSFTGNMLYVYFSRFAVYVMAILVLIAVAVLSNNKSAKMVCDFELVALLLNAGRRACAVAIMMINGDHISRSYYCWLAIYVVAFIAFYIIRNKAKKQTA